MYRILKSHCRNYVMPTYATHVRPLIEYACPAWHTSLTTEQSKQIERIQIRALKLY